MLEQEHMVKGKTNKQTTNGTRPCVRNKREKEGSV